MPSFASLIAQSSAHAWLFIPSAILLGALHGLEPGHSKTLMAAFIVAIRGTVSQAVLLGVAATISHTIVVWTIALVGMYLYQGVDADTVEPYMQAVSGVVIVALAVWMLWRTWKDQEMAKLAAGRVHGHDHHHGHSHDHDHGHDHGHSHSHDHSEVRQSAGDLGTDGYQDAHELAHANDIRRRFAGQTNVSNWQIAAFGLTGGLIPCPAAITVLLLCLQLKEIPLGAVLVLSFSIGLAVTLVAVGTIAAIGMRHASRRLSGFSTFARRAPYFSGALLILVGIYVGALGLSAIV